MSLKCCKCLLRGKIGNFEHVDFESYRVCSGARKDAKPKPEVASDDDHYCASSDNGRRGMCLVNIFRL